MPFDRKPSSFTQEGPDIAPIPKGDMRKTLPSKGTGPQPAPAKMATAAPGRGLGRQR